MAVPFTALYDMVRALTGNDDLDLGSEVLPDDRLKVLLTTAVLTLPTYSAAFPKLAWDDDITNGRQFFLAADSLAVVPDEVVQAVLHVAAHKYYLGLGAQHRANAERMETFIYKCSENLTGQAVETL